MARATISYEDVVKAVQRVEAAGDTPTILRVKQELGDKGSTTTISKYVKQYKVDRSQGKAPAKTDAEPKAEKKRSAPKKASSPKAKAEDAPKEEKHKHSSEDSPRESSEDLDSKPTSKNNDKSSEKSSDKRSDGEDRQRRPRDRDRNNRNRNKNDRNDRNDRNNRNRNNRNRDRNNNGYQNNNQQRRPQFPDQYDDFEQEVYITENLETMSENQLVMKVRQLETLINKEQSRREAAEKMAREAKEYADVIKEQIGQRVNDVKQTMEETISQLREEATSAKKIADEDLAYYRDQLDKANQKIVELSKK